MKLNEFDLQRILKACFKIKTFYIKYERQTR